MTTTWTIAIDWDRNGNYTGTYDDVTNRVTEATWSLGMKKPYQNAADNSPLTLKLSNHDRRYSPEYASGPLYGKLAPFRTVRIQSNDGSTTRTHWVGWIESINPSVGIYGERTVTITAAGPMQFLKTAEASLELQEDKRTDEIIAALLQQVVMPPASGGVVWALGVPGFSELGETTRLAGSSADYSDLEEGRLTLGMAADNWVK
jgi:hypothetical protein